MKPVIRTITFFLDINDFNKIEQIREAQDHLKLIFQQNGYEVQTTRLTTNILEHALIQGDIKKHEAKIQRAENDNGLDLIHMGGLDNPTIMNEAMMEELLNIFLWNKKAYAAINGENHPYEASRLGAQLMEKIREFDVFRASNFAVYSGIKTSTPFYPASKVLNNSGKFAIGLQSANLAVEESLDFKDSEDYREKLTKRMEEEYNSIFELIPINERNNFIGFDTSLAPFPDSEKSIVKAIENVQGFDFGLPGTLATCKLMTEIMQNNNIMKTGLNGLMLAVVEDNILAQRGIEGKYTVRDLLLFSCVCATGIDTVPLSNEVTSEKLAGTYLDLISLANKWNKPLSARMFFEKDKKAGDTVKYDWEFACEAPVMDI